MTDDMDTFMRRAITGNLLREVAQERDRQHAKWGQQNHPNGTGGEPGIEPFGYGDAADLADWLAYPNPGTVADFMRHRLEVMAEQGGCTYEAILTEEWAEALSEPDPTKLRAELIQVAAVAVAWAEKLDRIDLSSPPTERVHNHAPYRPECNERRLPDGQLRGACLNDDGSDRG